MATASVSNITKRNTVAYDRTAVLSWTLTSAADTGEAVELPNMNDRSVAISGTFGAGTVTLEGSIDGTNWFTLRDPQGNSHSGIAAAQLESILEATVWFRPKVVGADGSTSLTVSLLALG